MKIKFVLTTLLFFVFTITCFSQDVLSSSSSVDSVFDVIKINDTTFHCICKYEDPNDFVGLLHDDYMKMFGSIKQSRLHITITFKRKSKTRYELSYLNNVEIEELVYYRNKLWTSSFFNENSGDFMSGVVYSTRLTFPYNYQLESASSKTNNITTKTTFYSKGRIKSVEITDHNNGLRITIMKRCFDKKGNKIKCPQFKGKVNFL